jgi:hypothetical protein
MPINKFPFIMLGTAESAGNGEFAPYVKIAGNIYRKRGVWQAGPVQCLIFGIRSNQEKLHFGRILKKNLRRRK